MYNYKGKYILQQLTMVIYSSKIKLKPYSKDSILLNLI